jgi:hypothetical protein
MKYNGPYDQPGNPDAPYIDGNPAAGLQGSIVPAASIEYDQREVVEVIVRANARGYTDFANILCASPSNSDLTQLRKAIEGFIKSWAVPGVSWIIDSQIIKTVHGAGADFPNIGEAMYWLSHYTITTHGYVTFNIAAGQHIYNTTVALVHGTLNRCGWNGAAMIGSPPTLASFQYTGNRATDAAAQLAMLRTRYATELRFTGNNRLLIQGTILRNLLITNDGVRDGVLSCNDGIPGLIDVSVHGAGGVGINIEGGNPWTHGGCVSSSGNGTHGWAIASSVTVEAAWNIACSNGMNGIDLRTGGRMDQAGQDRKWGVKGNAFRGAHFYEGSAATMYQAEMTNNWSVAIFASSAFIMVHSGKFGGNGWGSDGPWVNHDIVAARNSYVNALYSTSLGTTSPPVNTFGNGNAQIAWITGPAPAGG